MEAAVVSSSWVTHTHTQCDYMVSAAVVQIIIYYYVFFIIIK